MRGGCSSRACSSLSSEKRSTSKNITRSIKSITATATTMTNKFQRGLYASLVRLVEGEESKAFYFKDHQLDNRVYRIFNYLLASYSDFCKPGALECRGIMFEMADDAPVDLVSMPMEKFFNLHENPMTMNLDLSQVKEIALKADGSLISTFIHTNGDGRPELRLKSKGSIMSTQSNDAMKFLETNCAFQNELFELAKMGYTINLEWCAPHNRVVVGYSEPQLTLLNIRNNQNGEYIDRTHPHVMELVDVQQYWIDQVEGVHDTAAFVESIPDMKNIEGYVATLASGQRIKIKTTWYLSLHRSKNVLNSGRLLFDVVIEEASDDVKSLWHYDPEAIKLIEDMELLLEREYNSMVYAVEHFHQRNHNLSQKEYAILAKEELASNHVGLAMRKYIGREVDYKMAMKKQWKTFVDG